jgi:antagonist of KipI
VDVMRVLAPGLMTTVQDSGRRAGLESGIPPGGAADAYAYRLNCVVLGNRAGAAVVEQALKGGSYQAMTTVTAALTGADMAATVNGRQVPLATAVTLRPGDVLETRVARAGCFGYLGVAGGFGADRVFGSASTYLDGGLGGLGGRTLRSGDVLALAGDGERAGPPTRPADGGAPRPAEAEPDQVAHPAENEWLCRPPGVLRFTRGPQQEYFGSAAYATFTAETYRVSPRSNRVGFRILGRCPAALLLPRTRDTGSGSTDIVEEGNPVGGIQIAGGQEIICLGRDCGTSGAYAKIGCLIGVDVSRMAQLAPGSRFRFAEVTADQARSIRAEYEAVLTALEHRAR